jgi:hypothetical protein
VRLARSPFYNVIIADWFGRPSERTLRLPKPRRIQIVKQYVIERDIAGVGSLNREQIKDTASTSNVALAKLAGRVQWLQSFVADDKTFCIYLADSEASVHEHARLSGFPASRVSEVRNIITPWSAKP